MTVMTAVDRVAAMAEARGLVLSPNSDSPGEYILVAIDDLIRARDAGPDEDGYIAVAPVFGPATLEECERWLDAP